MHGRAATVVTTLLRASGAHAPARCARPHTTAHAPAPAAQAAKLAEARARGKAEFQTTDAKFDERFQLGYNMAGEKVRFDGTFGDY